MTMPREPEALASTPPTPALEPDIAARRAGSEDYFRDQVKVVLEQILAEEAAHLPPPQDMGEDG